MSRLTDVQRFIDASRKVQSADDLHCLMQGIAGEMGFDHFALVHHVDLRPMGTMVNHVVTNDFITLSDYPQYWVDNYISGSLVSVDPVLLASQRMSAGFSWDELDKILKLTPAQYEIMERTFKAGLDNGFTVPANVPGELNGSCNFAVATGHEIRRDNIPMAQSVGVFAFQAARDLVTKLRQLPDFEPARLTDRQLECIVLVARGKTDWEIGKILGISDETVKQHLKDARERYDVTKRIQVVIRALFDGQIPLTELLH